MAKDEEVDETESEDEVEEEEDEVEERPKPKKHRKKRQYNFSTRAHGSPGGKNLYPKGTPVDARGIPLEDVDIDRQTFQRIGGLDSESARLNEQSKRVLERKARGETQVKWNSDAHTRYWEARRIYPRARVAIWQEFPVHDDAPAPVNFSICPTYDDLKQHVREKYWKGNHAIYAWRVYEDNYANLAIGRFEFAENLDWESNGRREPAPSPQQPAPVQQQFGMPGVMMPGVGGMPPIFMPQQVSQQSHQPNPVAPAQPGDPMAVIGPLLNYLLPLISNQAAQSAYLQNLPQVIEQKVKEAAPPPAPPAPPAPPPPTPVEQMEQAASIIQTVNRTGRAIATSLGFQQNPHGNEPPPADGEDDFPLQVRRVPGTPFNVAAQEGKVVDNLLMQGAVNAGPVIGIVDNFFKRLADSKKEAAEIELKTIEAKRQWEEQRLVNLERAASLQREMQVPQPKAEDWKPPPWAVEREPAAPPPDPEPKT